MDGLRINLQFEQYEPDQIELLFKRFDKGLGHLNFNGFSDIMLSLT